ncbi:uncharacterized protein LOC101855470 isoform X2 [Aplysia californica]|uniref:Uncharacterized protein LOC101855470 isoform X2 n=1 Tax=Aplysia californica TaxID=6500 RepID=A0ABM0JG25_APLCA|nr:uncharacterized protein LOC101855470 isoform X2 [Aplysia californica]
MSAEEDTPMQVESSDPPKEVPASTSTAGGGNENFVVLDMAGDSEDSDKEGGKEAKARVQKVAPADAGTKPAQAEAAVKVATVANPRVRKKPKAPVVDVNSLRKRKWQLKVYPLHADDLQLSYVSILCKLASESLLYIPSESRHGKAELYVATQKETAAIIGKLLRMEFHHKLLSIEVVRKDTGGKEDGDDSKKECKAYLMFDKFLSKKIFDAKGEKGTLIEKLVTLNKLPKAATKDFIGALFPFATEIDILESDDPEERKATVKCKTPVTSLLVYKSFKRLEINDVHVKLTVDDSVKAIQLPPLFFGPPPEKKDTGPPDSIESLNQSSLPRRRPLMTPLNRRVQQIKKRALLARKKPTRGQLMRGQRGPPLMEEPVEEMGRPGGRRSLLNRGPESRLLPDMMKNRGPVPLAGNRDYPGGPGRRRLNERQGDRRNRDRDSMERRGRRGNREESQVTKEMLQLQNQLNQAIKNQIAMLNTAQGGSGSGGGAPMRGGLGGAEPYPMPGSSHRASLLGHGPRHFGEPGGMGPGPRAMDQHHPEFGGSSWPSDRGRVDRGDRADRERPDRAGDRDRMARGDRMDRANRPERGVERGDRMERPSRLEARPERLERGSRDRGERERASAGGDIGRQPQRGQRQTPAFGGGGGGGGGGGSDSGRVKADRAHAGAGAISSSHGADPSRGNSRSGRGTEFSASGRAAQRNESSYNSSSHPPSGGSGRYGDYNSQVQGENGNYYRRY